MAARLGKGADDDKAAQEAEAERIAEEVKHVILNMYSTLHDNPCIDSNVD